jgi:hypothetical protein
MEANLSGIDAPKSKRSPLMPETPIAQRLASVPAAAAAARCQCKKSVADSERGAVALRADRRPDNGRSC